MGALPDNASTTLREHGNDALELASEFSDRIARERATVRALKAHLLRTVSTDGHRERLKAPPRQASLHVPMPEPWERLGEHLDCRRALTPQGSVRLELSGEVDLSGSLRLRQLIKDVLAGDVHELSLDLGRVSLMDSNALSALLWVRR